MNEKKIKEYKKRIDEMSQYDMAYRWRFAKTGNVFFRTPLGEYFKKSFESKGGMTSRISKLLG